MNQSSVIFFFLFAAYLVFITTRGELPLYMGFLLSAPKGAAPAKQDTAAKSSDAATAADYASYATTAAEIAVAL